MNGKDTGKAFGTASEYRRNRRVGHSLAPAVMITRYCSADAPQSSLFTTLIFNKNKNFLVVLEAIPLMMESHTNYKRTVNQDSGSRFRYVLSHKDDASRELTLTILAFDVPRQS
uniref:Uncharacterized protein n=1 Tax=Candidatus Kentrum sp. SD TaxID=2126332 RepID=A0A451BMD2_9GAMM|nr:MAG: hypothetical protein BECKSD772F_GA0070984_101328 [Candidatus Kentron sp. SD]VFK42328.1 MAG: hypothetical protein BECKSD772E_GA0070983_101624 [Candidatus Kentron sp. SD]VFK79452.1 MAG: hypothetical protein BECKSD772D_GA0070982_105018 [Candidatus Kentron sp. SD]